MDSYMTLREVADYLQVSTTHLYRSGLARELGFRVGGSWRFSVARVRRFTEGDERGHLQQ